MFFFSFKLFVSRLQIFLNAFDNDACEIGLFVWHIIIVLLIAKTLFELLICTENQFRTVTVQCNFLLFPSKVWISFRNYASILFRLVAPYSTFCSISIDDTYICVCYERERARERARSTKSTMMIKIVLTKKEQKRRRNGIGWRVKIQRICTVYWHIKSTLSDILNFKSTGYPIKHTFFQWQYTQERRRRRSRKWMENASNERTRNTQRDFLFLSISHWNLNDWNDSWQKWITHTLNK